MIVAPAVGGHVYQIFKHRSISRPRRTPEASPPSSTPELPSSPCESSPTPQPSPEPPPPPAHASTESSFAASSPDPEAALARALIVILTRDPEPRETIEAAFRRKEQDLGDVFATLTPPDARALQERLDAAHADDALATQFGRLSRERRQRLLTFLADTPRRAARLAHMGRP